MPTIATTVYPDEAYVRVDADWTDLPQVIYARVIRRNTVTGEEVALRPYGAYNADGDLLLTCGLGMWWDTEPPQGVALEYRTEAADVLANAATNSSFETGTAPWTVTGGTLAASGVFAHSGAFSGLLTPTGGVFAPNIAQTLIPVDPAKDVTVSAWALTPQGWNAVRVQIRWFNSGALQVGTTQQTDIEILDDSEWRFIQAVFTPPADAVNATYTFQVSGTPAASVLFYLDQLELAQLQPVPNIAIAALVTVTGTFDFYIKDPLNPCNDRTAGRCMPGPAVECNPIQAMMVPSYGPRETYEPNSIQLQPVNRKRGRTVSRERRDADLGMNVITRTFADRDALKATLAPGTLLFIQAPVQYGIEDRYVDVGSYTIDVPTKDFRIQPRYFSLPLSVRDRPAGPANGVCGARIDDLCDIYTSWAAMTIAGLTWEDLMLGLASPSGPGQPPISGMRTFDEVAAEFVDFNAVNTGGRTFDGLRDGL